MLKKIISVIVMAVCICVCNLTYADSAQEQKNKETAIAFFNAVVVKKDFASAVKYMGPWFTEHSPHGTDGVAGIKNLIEFLKNTYPNSRAEIKRAIADGDYVMLHVHSIFEPNTLGTAVAEIFRFDNGKVVEHWDVMQDVPAHSDNNNGMF